MANVMRPDLKALVDRAVISILETIAANGKTTDQYTQWAVSIFRE
jgi:hypothetical protein